MSKYLFVSDIHGRDTLLENKLLEITVSDNVPDIVFFLGDIVGTEGLDKLQKLFYNGVYNAAKKATKENPQISDSELLNYSIDNGRTIENGLDDLWIYLYGTTIPTNKANHVRELTQYVHYGHFVSNLPETIRHSLQKDMEANAKVWVDIMTMLTNIGSKVVIVEGNWDARNPLDFYPTKECKPLPVKERTFYFKDFIKLFNDKVLYFDQVGTVETDDKIFVIWPFDSSINPPPIPQFDKNEKRKIILISHGQIDWESIKGNTSITAEGQKIQNNMPMIFRNVKATTAVHGHIHDNISTDGYLFEGKFIHYLPKGVARFIDF